MTITVTSDEYDAIFGHLDGSEAWARTTVAEAISTVSAATGVTESMILGYSRTARIVRARQLAMYKARAAGLTLEQIGAHMNRDHTTVLAGVKAISRRLGEAKETTQ